MPVIRQPLRDRCNVRLNVFTSITDDPSRADALARESSRGRKAQKPVPDVRIPHPNPAKIHAPTTPRLYPLGPGAFRGLQCLQTLVPYLYVAFHDGPQLPRSVVADDGTAFSHIVKITHASDQKPAGAAQVKSDMKRGIQSLVLVARATALPPGSSRPIVERNTTVLTEAQLLAARDFLALALPYYSEAHPSKDSPSASADPVRLLIIAPAGNGAAADIMAIAVSYLAFASAEKAEMVLKYVDQEETVSESWKNAIGAGKDGVDLLNRVAMLA